MRTRMMILAGVVLFVSFLICILPGGLVWAKLPSSDSLPDVHLSSAEGFHDTADVEAITRRIESRADLPVGVRFRQEITLRFLFFTWRFHSDIHQTEDGLEAITVGAPSQIPDTIAHDLIDATRSPSMFELQSGGTEDGFAIFKGPRRDYKGTGPIDAVLWVNVKDWVIEKAEIAYDWGKLYVSQEYQDVEGHTLLHKQSARVTPYGAQLDVVYADYRF